MFRARTPGGGDSHSPVRVHFTSARSGARGRLAQAAAVHVELGEPMYLQVDGEPWLQPPGCLTVEHAGTSSILRGPTSQELRRYLLSRSISQSIMPVDT